MEEMRSWLKVFTIAFLAALVGRAAAVYVIYVKQVDLELLLALFIPWSPIVLFAPLYMEVVSDWLFIWSLRLRN